jgi:hypothetical protein
MRAFWIAYLTASATATLLFIAVGLWTRRVREGERAADRTLLRPAIGRDSAEGMADVHTCMQVALTRLTGVLDAHGVRVEFGMIPGLLVRMSGTALTDLLEELLIGVIHEAPNQRICVTAREAGEQILIALDDDSDPADARVRVTKLRSIAARVAVLGGILEVESRPDFGTMVSLRVAIGRVAPSSQPVTTAPVARGDALRFAPSNWENARG